MNRLEHLLEAVADRNPDQARRRWKLLSAFGELQFRRDGGGHCGLCNVHVRYNLPATVKRDDHPDAQYGCLCTRCIESERAQGHTVVIRAGDMIYEFPGLPPEESPFDECQDVDH